MTLRSPYLDSIGRGLVGVGNANTTSDAPLLETWIATASADDIPASTPDNNWTNPANAEKALITNNAGGSATISLNSTDTTNSWLRTYTYGITHPATATMVGIEVDIYYTDVGTAPNTNLESLHLSWGASAATMSATDQGAGAVLPTTDYSVATYGGPADLWGETSATLIAAMATTDFGVSLRVDSSSGAQTVGIDAIGIRYYYTITAAGLLRSTQTMAEVILTQDSDVRVTQHYIELLRSETVVTPSTVRRRVMVVT
jgi:hypothetical protein